MTEVLERGEHIFLRRPEAQDAAELIQLNKASIELHTGWTTPPTTPEQYAMYLERTQHDDFAGFFVCRSADGAIVGVVNLSQIFRSPFQNAMMGYYAGAPFAGQGYMTEAVGLVLKHTFETLLLHRIEANIQPDNLPSIALAKRLGFTLEGYSRRYLQIGGHWRDHERWAILAEDWEVSRSR
ncbi:MAG: GNAT family N-acetyltransferase [Herpetosiphonaceae bacterium]|nr:GNAT family N-acetyltransferase [Herpetosiphonaceae bacterium]